ncbi:MAG: putative glycosyltransferase [Dinoroseobacter sp.]
MKIFCFQAQPVLRIEAGLRYDRVGKSAKWLKRANLARNVLFHEITPSKPAFCHTSCAGSDQGIIGSGFRRMKIRMPQSTTAPVSASPRIMLYSHDTLGYGHLRRNLLIAKALSDLHPQPEILLIGGIREAGAFAVPPRADFVTLPAYAKQSDGSYQPRELGDDIKRLARMRSRIIMSAAEAFDPDLLIVDNVPRGAQYELDETLAALSRRGRCKIVLGLRDVIDDSRVVRRQWLRQRNFETVRRHYDFVWVYGDPMLYDLLADCAMARPLGNRATHVGLLDPTARGNTEQAAIDHADIAGADPRPYVFCAVGGGRDGAALCEAFANAPMPKGHRGVLVTGTQMPDALRDTVAGIVAARDDMTMLPFVREPFAVMGGAARLIGMGGYNTTMEFLTLSAPSLIVPRCVPRREQVMRTSRLAGLGMVSMLLPDDLSAEALGDWLARPALSKPNMLDMGGLGRIQDLTRAILGSEPADSALRPQDWKVAQPLCAAA